MTQRCIIVVENPREWFGDQRLGAFYVSVDGSSAGAVLPEKRLDIECAPGRHTVRVRQWWYRSRPVIVELRPGEMRRLMADVPREGSFLARMAQGMLRPWSCLSLDDPGSPELTPQPLATDEVIHAARAESEARDDHATRVSRAWLILNGIGASCLLLLGIVLGLMHSAVGWWLVACVIAGWVVTLRLVLHGRRTAGARRLETGPDPRPAESVHGRVGVVPVQTRRWVGGGVVAGSVGNLTASWPMAVLELRGDELTLRLRPRGLVAVFGVQGPVRIRASEDSQVCAARGLFGAAAIGLRSPTGQHSYFFCRDRKGLLSVLATAGFNVDWTVRRISYTTST